MSEPTRRVTRRRGEFDAELRNIATRLRTWRLYRRYSIRKLSHKSDVNQTRIQSIESCGTPRRPGPQDCRMTTLMRLARGLGITLYTLLNTLPTD